MTFALPRNIQLKLEQTLAQWCHWHCAPVLTSAPEVVRVLTPGVSNFSVLVRAEQHFVVRIDGLNPSAHGLSRQTEWRTLEAAHRAGLAPAPRYCNPELGSLVCDYLAPEDAHVVKVADVARLLRAIHSLPARHHRLDLGERILRYEKQIEHRGRSLGDALRNCHHQVAALLRAMSRQPADRVLCHNDLLRANRIYSAGRLWAVDWEYAAMASPWYDIAVVINGDSLSASDTDALLIAYLGRVADERERDMLHQYGCIYRYLELLWYLALDKQMLEPSAIEKKSSALLNMLNGAQSSRES
jgi:thiamine kinase